MSERPGAPWAPESFRLPGLRGANAWLRARRRARRWAPGAAAAALAVYVLTVLWTGGETGLFEHLEKREQIARTVAEARRLGLTWEKAIADPAAAIGKPVLWCVDHPTSGPDGYVASPSQPITLENSSAFPVAGGQSGGRCADVLAVIVKADDQGLSLRFEGRP